MHDTLDVLIDPSLVFEKVLYTPEDSPREDGPWWLKFYDPDGAEDFHNGRLDLPNSKYDWSDPEWVRQNAKNPLGFYPIYLTQGFFMIVSKRDYKRMTTYPNGTYKKWCVRIEKNDIGDIEKVYACRGGKGDEPTTPRAHREVLYCLYKSGDVDHVNGWGLDNRGHKSGVNLILCSTGVNIMNTSLVRRVNIDLLRGVEKRGVNKKGQQLFGGIRSRRLKKRGKGSVKTVRSKRVWLSQEPANRWYLKQIERLSNGRTSWIHAGTINFPVFPPLRESEPSAKSLKLRKRVERQAHALEDVPF